MVRIPRSLALGLALGMSVGACFDSDDKFRAAGTTTGEPMTTTTTTTEPDTSTGEPPASSSGEADLTCRDAIACIRDCALSIDPTDPEPDLSCILECTEDPRLTPREVYHLLRLIECANGICMDLGECEVTSDTTGTGTGTGTGTSSGGGDEGGVGFLPPCLQCIFLEVLQPNPELCLEFHQACV